MSDTFDETSKQFMSRLDRDSSYRIAALNNAINRAAQDGGLSGGEVDVLGLAEIYYAWLTGEVDIKIPDVEELKNFNIHKPNKEEE